MGQLATGDRRLVVHTHRAPLALPAAGLALGIAAGRYIPAPVGVWGLLAGLSLAVAIAAMVRSRRTPAGGMHLETIATAAILAGVFALGAVRSNLAWRTVDPDDIVTYTDRQPMLATVRGWVYDEPQVYDPAETLKFGYRPGKCTTFLLAASQIKVRDSAGEGWHDVTGMTRVTIDQPDWRLHAGQGVELVGWLSRPAPPSNPGQRDATIRARQSGVLSRLRVEASDAIELRGQSDASWIRRAIWTLRSQAGQRLSQCSDDESGDLVEALTLGERSPALQTLNRAMMSTGVAHLLSISGMHLAVFLGFVFLLCRLIGATQRRAAVIVLMVLGTYLMLTEWRAPLLRSAIMAAAMCGAAILRRGRHSLNALCLAGIILLSAGPTQLFDAGFQLSFGIVAGLILLRLPIRRAIFGRVLRRRGLIVFRQENRVRRWLNYSAANWLMDATAVSLAAYAVSVPLAAVHFGIFSPYASILTLLLLPLVTAVLVPAYLALATAWIAPNLSDLFARAAQTAAYVLSQASMAAATLPGACVRLRPVAAPVAIGAFAVIAIWMLRRWIPLGRLAALLATAALACAAAWTQWPAGSTDAAELNVLAVGNGQCVVLRTPSGRTFILDAGTRSGYDAGAMALTPFLTSQRLPAPQSAFVSHANTDHYNAIPSLLTGDMPAARPPQKLYLNDYFAASPNGGADARRFLDLARQTGIEVVRLHAGETVRLDEQTMVEVLSPPAQHSDALAGDDNESSLVLRVTCGRHSALVPGDIGAGGMGVLLKSGASLKADVLVMPHHGGWPTHRKGEPPDVLARFLAAVAPQVVIVSRTGEPRIPLAADEQDRREFYERLKIAFQYYSTACNGWIQVRLGNSDVTVKTMR